MITFPNAKINLGLNIVGKREDGYHNLETVFYPLMIRDALEITPSADGEAHLDEGGNAVGVEMEKNLVIKALRMVEKECGVKCGVNVTLEKAIPFGAGLGGGSADATFMLKLLYEYYGLGIEEERMIDMAARLGADCPFFVKNKAVYAEGIGERMTEIDLSLKGKTILLVKPDVFVSTAEAFAGVCVKKPEVNCRDIVSRDIREWRGLLTNDFEASIFPKHPEIREIKERMYEAGALYASMSGSGSSVYGIFDGEIPFGEKDFAGCYYKEVEG